MLLRQSEAEWVVLGLGDKGELAAVVLMFECLLYDLHPGQLQVREVTAAPETADVSVFSLAAARCLLRQFSYTFSITAEQLDSAIDDIKEVVRDAAGLTSQALSELMASSERFMAQKYLEVAFGSSHHSKSSSLKTSVCSQSFMLDNAHMQTSTDVTSRPLSSLDSSEPASRMEEAQRFTHPVLKDSLDEDPSADEELRAVTSPQSASTGPLFSWTFVPPANRAPDDVQDRFTSEESESRRDLVFIEYSHHSPRSSVLQRLTMSEISEDDAEDGRTQLDPRFLEGLEEDCFLSTTPKFRMLPALLDFEESKPQRPPSFSSCDFASVQLESPAKETDAENTMGRVFHEPKCNQLPHSFVQRTSLLNDSVNLHRRTCGTACTLL